MNQHYVSRFYIENFLANDAQKIWEYSLERKTWKQRPIKRVASAPHFFTLTDWPESEKLIFEEAAQKIESGTAKTVKKVIARKPLTLQEAADLAGFVAFTQCRTPLDIDMSKHFFQQLLDVFLEQYLADESRFQFLADDFEKKTGMKIGKEFVQGLKIEPTKALVLNGSHIKMNALSELLIHMKQTFLRVEESVGSFITSDYPVTTIDGNANGFGPSLISAKVEVFMPLGKQVGLMLTNDEEIQPEVTIDANLLRKLNIRTLRFASRFIYSGSICFLGDDLLHLY